MSKTQFKLTGKWKKLTALIDPARFEGALKKNVGRATEWNARLVAKEMRARITAGKYTGNADLTMVLKGSEKPLAGREGALFQAITHVRDTPFRAFAGVIRRREGDVEITDIAVTIHEGVTMQVTPAMRWMFESLARATEGRLDPSQLRGRAAEIFEELPEGTRIYPLKDTTDSIVIPPRPFMRLVFEDGAMLAKVRRNWTAAVDAALRGVDTKLVS